MLCSLLFSLLSPGLEEHSLPGSGLAGLLSPSEGWAQETRNKRRRPCCCRCGNRGSCSPGGSRLGAPTLPREAYVGPAPPSPRPGQRWPELPPQQATIPPLPNSFRQEEGARQVVLAVRGPGVSTRREVRARGSGLSSGSPGTAAISPAPGLPKSLLQCLGIHGLKPLTHSYSSSDIRWALHPQNQSFRDSTEAGALEVGPRKDLGRGEQARLVGAPHPSKAYRWVSLGRGGYLEVGRAGPRLADRVLMEWGAAGATLIWEDQAFRSLFIPANLGEGPDTHSHASSEGRLGHFQGGAGPALPSCQGGGCW
ncbi:uncharacterized protein LOC103796309 [Callithrix jacchus]|uniref:uncharacterized protein LOC103796309 n=1 Tax=Callithrix jacchus TaxID=9483 RepID=UPI0004F067FA|nr:uncharacterized protein LOC103796309 [Callithrix jacchus]